MQSFGSIIEAALQPNMINYRYTASSSLGLSWGNTNCGLKSNSAATPVKLMLEWVLMKAPSGLCSKRADIVGSIIDLPRHMG